MKNRTNKRRATALMVIAAAALIAAACGDDKGGGTTTTGATATTAAPVTTAAPQTTAAPTTAAPETTAGPETTAAPVTTAAAKVDLDTNHDGKVQFGIAAAGPADDGAYYQAVVDAAKQLSKDNGFADPIVVDKIEAADAATAIGDLAQQGVDVIIIGASEIAEPLPDLIKKYPSIFWYCNCGAGFPANAGLAQSTDDGAEISYTAGYATGLLMKAKGPDAKNVTFLGCCDLGFEKQAYMTFELALKAVDPSFTMTYVPTGSHPYDFDNTANATAALQTAIDNKTAAVYPYLGGAHRPVVQAANKAGLIVMSAGSSKACADTELKYDLEVKFDGGDYLRAVMKKIIDGTLHEGDTYKFKVGVDPEPGAVICNPTPDQKAAMDDIYKRIAAGEFAAKFGEIAGKAFAKG